VIRHFVLRINVPLMHSNNIDKNIRGPVRNSRKNRNTQQQGVPPRNDNSGHLVQCICSSYSDDHNGKDRSLWNMYHKLQLRLRCCGLSNSTDALQYAMDRTPVTPNQNDPVNNSRSRNSLTSKPTRLNVKVANLVEADEDVIVSESVTSDHAFIELVWRERLLGMNLLLNDDSGLLKVVNFPRGSQARVVCERRGFDSDAFKGATIFAVNGTQYDDQEEIFESLKHPARPKTISFRLADTKDAERLRKVLEMHQTLIEVAPDEREFKFREVNFFDEGDLGILFQPTNDNVGLVVSGFVEGSDGIVLAAERSGDVLLGDLLTHINNETVIRPDGDGLTLAMKLLGSSAIIRPLLLTFADPYLHNVDIQKVDVAPGSDCGGGPSELVLNETNEGGKRRVLVTGFTNISGMAERCGVLIGDQLVFVNGLPVGAGCRWLDAPSSPSLKEVMDMLSHGGFYPIGLTFARRQQQNVSRWSVSTDEFLDSEAETICVTASSQDRLGMLLMQMENGDIVVTDFQGVPGIFQQALERCKQKNGSINLAVESINGQIVPSYLSIDIVLNALNRSWATSGSTLLTLCDDEQKYWLMSNV
jgi:hypothetical protein